MAELLITRGLPGSGKTTWAKAWVNVDPIRHARVNRDDLRQLLYNRDYPLDPDGARAYEMEKTVTVAQREAVRGLLLAGKSVVVDDTHLQQKYIRVWQELASVCGVGCKVIDQFLMVTLDECIRRDALRERSVGADVLRALDRRLQSSLKDTSSARPGRRWTYTPDTSRSGAYIVDVDGTLARMDGRGPFEWHRVEEDKPNRPVIDMATALWNAGYAIILLSGRDEVCRAETAEWLRRNDVYFTSLVMRGQGDHRPDEVIKLELFRERVAPFWNVRGVLDDRDKVVRMWRSIGLLCAQVAPGAF